MHIIKKSTHSAYPREDPEKGGPADTQPRGSKYVAAMRCPALRLEGLQVKQTPDIHL